MVQGIPGQICQLPWEPRQGLCVPCICFWATTGSETWCPAWHGRENVLGRCSECFQKVTPHPLIHLPLGLLNLES